MFKLLGLVLGVIYGGFWGAFAGLLIGSVIDSLFNSKVTVHKRVQYHSQDQFVHILMVMTAEVMKADNKLLNSELNYVKNWLFQNLGAQQAQQALYDLKEILDTEQDVQGVCNDMRLHGSIQERLLILQFLFGLAGADSEINNAEMNVIQRIAGWMGISQNDFESLKYMFMGSNSRYGQYGGGYQNGSSSQYRPSASTLENDYKILEITADATDEEVKKAYRKAAMKHHPDKVSHLGEEMRKAAEEKFSKLNEAYDRIKKSRGMN